MLVYRIEDDSSVGPYQNNLEWMSNPKRHTAPYRPEPGSEYETAELGKFRNGVHLAAFKDLKQLTRWFIKQERKTLKDLGYKISVYEVCESAILFGKRQVAFNLHFASVVKTKALI